MKFLTLASAVAVAFGSCPNQCSGHGRCGEDDKCICYTSGSGTAHPTRSGYFGVDCSQRTCPAGPAYDAITTSMGSVSPISFKGAETKSQDYLRVSFVPSARSTSLTTVPLDANVVVKIMTTNTQVNQYGTFTWKFDTEEYFRAEEKFFKYDTREDALQLQQPDANGVLRDSGIFIWWDENKFSYTSAWASCITTAPSSSCVNPGDMYTFTVNVNHDKTFDAGNSNTAHQEIECSGRGSCDFSSGKCACFDGYTGDACQRTVCPNACSGHGACQNENRFITDLKKDSNLATVGAGYANAYDANQQYGCKCDSGYRGPDCSMIECPSGEDPMDGDGGSEGRDCSGRGICDYSSGVCKCFKGFYGERCDAQTNFV